TPGPNPPPRMPGGANPMGAAPRPARLDEFGIGYSGFAKSVGGENWETVFKFEYKEWIPNGYAGRAAVHVWATDEFVLVQPPGVFPNGMLQAELTWKSGRGTGQQFLDLTRGHVVQVGGTTAMTLRARQISSVEGQDLIPYARKRVEATINWFGSTDQPAVVTTPTVTLAAATPSAAIPVPLQAKSVQAFSPTFAALAALELTLLASPTVGAPVIAQTVDPYANPLRIAHGAEFIRLLSPAPMLAWLLFELW
ncbi:MAG: hypothetical protein L0221_14280, partial [Chloroflexi bacterium]|nr:hypothetical protein [Chloroflexota bacterium]